MKELNLVQIKNVNGGAVWFVAPVAVAVVRHVASKAIVNAAKASTATLTRKYVTGATALGTVAGTVAGFRE